MSWLLPSIFRPGACKSAMEWHLWYQCLVRPLSSKHRQKAQTHGNCAHFTVYHRYSSCYSWHAVTIERSCQDRSFGGTQDSLRAADRQLEHENARVGWAEHQASASPKHDISCLFYVGFIYWLCNLATRVYGSLIRPVGPNLCGWTQISDAIG